MCVDPLCNCRFTAYPQIERISQLEAQRSVLLGQLPAELQQKVLKRQKDAATDEGMHLDAALLPFLVSDGSVVPAVTVQLTCTWLLPATGQVNCVGGCMLVRLQLHHCLRSTHRMRFYNEEESVSVSRV